MNSHCVMWIYSATPILNIFNFPLEYALGGNIHKFTCLLWHSSVIGIPFKRGQRDENNKALQIFLLFVLSDVD